MKYRRYLQGQYHQRGMAFLSTRAQSDAIEIFHGLYDLLAIGFAVGDAGIPLVKGPPVGWIFL